MGDFAVRTVKVHQGAAGSTAEPWPVTVVGTVTTVGGGGGGGSSAVTAHINTIEPNLAATAWLPIRPTDGTSFYLLPTQGQFPATLFNGRLGVDLSAATAQVIQGTSPWVVGGTIAATARVDAATAQVFQGTDPWNILGSVAATANVAAATAQVFQGTDPWNVGGTIAATANVEAATAQVFQGTNPWNVGGSLSAVTARVEAATAQVFQGTDPWVTRIEDAAGDGIDIETAGADAASNDLNELIVGSMLYGYNGASWDRVRNTTAVPATDARGINMRAVPQGADAEQAIAQINVPTSASSWTIALTANTDRAKAIFRNESSLSVYLAYNTTAASITKSPILLHPGQEWIEEGLSVYLGNIYCKSRTNVSAASGIVVQEVEW